MKTRHDIEFVAGPAPIDPEAMMRVENMLAALQSLDDCNDETRDDDRSSAGHKKEAERLELAAKAAEASGNTTEAAALRAKAETHKEEIGRTDGNRSPGT